MPQFKTVFKDKLFHDKFNYCIGFFVEEATCLREVDHDYIDKILERRIQFRNVTQQRWLQSKLTILTKANRPILPITGEHLHEIADILINSKSDYKSVVSIDNMWVYTNDLDLIKDLDNLDYLKFKKYTRAVVNRPRNTIIVKYSKFTKRTHLRSVRLTEVQSEKLRNFLIRNKDEIRISPGLMDWCNSSYFRTLDYYFIDYDDEGWLTMISLINPQLIGKTLAIQKE
jgi:hypothetical protein